MKRKLFLTLIALIVAMVSVQAQYIDDLYYNLDDDTQTAEVNHGYNMSGELIIPETVTYNGITYSVTSIRYGAFRNCRHLTSVTIPNSVTSISSYAFSGCSGLTSVTIGNSVTSIGERVFYGCSSLTSIVWNAKNYEGEDTFDYRGPFDDIHTQITSFTFGENVEYIPIYLCFMMSKLTSIIIPNSVTSIGYEAFYGCNSLTSVTIPNSVTSIGGSAFSGCSSLPVIDNLRYADTYLVEAVDETLSTYNIKEGTKWIGNGAFSWCNNLTSITIPNSVTSIGSFAFSHCSSLTSVTIPDSVTSIESGVFVGCSSLTSITIPNSATSIGVQAFSNCSSLISVTIPGSVTSIGYEAFNGCSSLTSVTIPNSVTSIGSSAFFDCERLSSIYNYASVPQYIEHYTFANVDTKTCVLYVPKASVQAYSTALTWQDFKHIIGVDVPEDTAIDEVFSSNTTEKTQKVLIDGNIYLLTPDGRKLNIQGAEVK